MNSNSTHYLQLQHLVLGYQQPLTPRIDWQLRSGERWALTGPNGSGKSLLLKTLSGQLPPLAGVLQWVQGAHWVYLAQEHPRPAPWPLNGYDWLKAMGVQASKLPLVEHLLDQRLDQLSGGQWQLLRLASVLGSDAEVIFLDEPSNHLDMQVREQSLMLLSRLKPHQCLVMASHDQDFIQASGAEELPVHKLWHQEAGTDV